jgi:hypothetical protein
MLIHDEIQLFVRHLIYMEESCMDGPTRTMEEELAAEDAEGG